MTLLTSLPAFPGSSFIILNSAFQPGSYLPSLCHLAGIALIRLSCQCSLLILPFVFLHFRTPFQLGISSLNSACSWRSVKSPLLCEIFCLFHLYLPSLIDISEPKLHNVQHWVAKPLKVGKEYSKSSDLQGLCPVSHSSWWSRMAAVPLSGALFSCLWTGEMLFYLRGSVEEECRWTDRHLVLNTTPGPQRKHPR